MMIERLIERHADPRRCVGLLQGRLQVATVGIAKGRFTFQVVLGLSGWAQSNIFNQACLEDRGTDRVATRAHIYIYIHTYMCIYICMYMCTYMYSTSIHIYIYMYTYIHTIHMYIHGILKSKYM